MIKFPLELFSIDADSVFEYDTNNGFNIVKPQKGGVYFRHGIDNRTIYTKLNSLNEGQRKYWYLYTKMLTELMLKEGVQSYRNLVSVHRATKELHYFNSRKVINNLTKLYTKKHKELINFTIPNDNNEQLKPIDNFINKYHLGINLLDWVDLFTICLSKELLLQKISKDQYGRITRLKNQYFNKISVWNNHLYVGSASSNTGGVTIPIIRNILIPDSKNVIEHICRKRFEYLDHIINDMNKYTETMINEYPALYAMTKL